LDGRWATASRASGWGCKFRRSRRELTVAGSGRHRAM
jgi:hypothetical protein